MKQLFFTVIWLLEIMIVFGQGEIDDQDKIFYRNERSFAVLLNNNGFGANFRYGKRLNAFRKSLYEIDFVGIKHPKEKKVTSIGRYDYNSFVYGKDNNFFNLRAGLGYEKELFQKIDRGGISIRYFINGGAALGFEKPIYYAIWEDINGNQYEDPNEIVPMKFDKTIHTMNYVGSYPFIEGIDETKVIPGVYGKIGATFEFSSYDQVLTALEAGIVVDAFWRKIEIMDIDRNNRLFFTMYIAYRFGRVLNAQLKNRRTKFDQMLDQ